ncbi:MAG TPA: polyprenyl synthetase family protein [Chloroflexota bacterium]|jgi:geranylgeranyl diphosphate synthase type I|nr:polyprenyl synthetase family protein [Chloroflexota bacterium]
MTPPTQARQSASVDLSALLAHYSELLQAELHTMIQGTGDLRPFYGMMAYHMGWVDQAFVPVPARAGKSLRPALCLLLADGLGADPGACAPLAAGIEILHNFSLVHDDIEDRSMTRRGRPTVWSIWGEAQAVNVGDGLFSLAHQLCLRAPLAQHQPAVFVPILQSLERAIITLCEGQFLDMSGEGNLDLSSDAYLRMIARKTASLIGEAAWVGARVATDDPATLDAARRFGVELGLAFQIRDDILGIWGDEGETGKSASSDIATRKMTLPIILALEAGSDTLRARYGAPPQDPDDEQQVRALLEATGALQRTDAAEHVHWQAAMEALDQMPLPADWRELVRHYARSFVERRA